MTSADRLQPFVDIDERRGRRHFPLDLAVFVPKLECHLPREIVEGKRVLDLGCCCGLVGQWVLDLGAASYTGVDISAEYVARASRLLAPWGDRARLIEAEMQGFLASCAERYEVVVAMGVLYGTLNPVGCLLDIARITDERLLVESLHPVGGRARQAGVFYHEQPMVTPGQHVHGLSARPSLPAITAILQAHAFERDETRAIRAIGMHGEVHDTYLPVATTKEVQVRFVASFSRVAVPSVSSLESMLHARNDALKAR